MADKNTGATSGRDILLLVLAAGFMGATIGGFIYNHKITAENQTWQALAKQLSTDVTTISAVGRDATRGIDPDFGTLEALSTAFGENIKALGEGDPGNNITPVPAAAREGLDGVTTAWKTMKAAVDEVLKGETPYTNTRDNIGQLTERVDSVMEAPITPAQEAQLQRIKVTAAQILSTGRDAAITATQLRGLANGYVGGSGPGLREITEKLVADAPAVAKPPQSAAGLQGAERHASAASRHLGPATCVPRGKSTTTPCRRIARARRAAPRRSQVQARCPHRLRERAGRQLKGRRRDQRRRRR